MGLLDKILNRNQPRSELIPVAEEQSTPTPEASTPDVQKTETQKEVDSMKSELQQLIDNASAHDVVTIPVGKGEIAGPACIDKPLTLIGNDCFFACSYRTCFSGFGERCRDQEFMC